MVVTQNSELASRVRSLRNRGRSNSGDWLQHAEVGYTYRLSELHAALGLAQLRRIDSILARRDEIALSYNKRFQSESSLIRPLVRHQDKTISWFVYVVRLRDDVDSSRRERIVEAMAAKGIACGR